MSKKFSKTRKISRKQRSKKNRKSRSNPKRGGGLMNVFKSATQQLLDKLYSDAITKFGETDTIQKDKIMDAIDNLSKLGKNVPDKEGVTNPYNLDNYETKQDLLDASEKIKQTKIMYIKSKGTSELPNEYGVTNLTKQRKCINLCKELGLVERKRTTTGLQQKFYTYGEDSTCNEICDPEKQ
jgi:hypothetical protein